MKRLYIVLICCVLSSTGFSQVTDVATGLNEPYKMIVSGDDLYYSNAAGDIRKIDLTATNPVATTFAISNPQGYYDFALTGDTLHVITSNGKIVVEKIANFPQSGSIVATVDVVSDHSMAVTQNSLGVVNYYVASTDGIDMLDFANSPTAVPQSILTGLSFPISDLEVHNGYLYFSYSTLIGKIDLANLSTPYETVYDGAGSAPTGMAFIGDDLYFSDSNNGRVLKANINQTLPVMPTDTFTIGGDAFGLGSYNGDIYCCSTFGNKIVRIDPGFTSTNVIKEAITWSIYPNPTQESIQFDGLETTQSYQIVDAMGRIIKQGLVQPDDMISVKALSSGMYYISLDNGDVQQFIKQ